MTPRNAARFATIVWVALVLAIAGGTFAGVLDYGFVWDDGPFIVWNESLRGAGSLRRIFVAGDAYGTGLQNPYYRPLTTLSFAIDWRLFGENPAGYHATNLLLHLVVSALLFRVALQLTGRRPAAAAAALLFAVHPAITEPVAYVSARADLLCALFTLGAWLLFLRGRAASSSRDLRLAAVAFALALLAKIVAFALLPLLALGELLLVPRRERRFGTLVPFAGLALAFLLVRGLVLESTTWGFDLPFSSRLAAAGPLLLTYVEHTLRPFDLKVFYDVPLRTSWGDAAVLGAWAIIIGCAGVWFALLRRRPVVAIGLAWFFAGLLPVSGVVALLYPAPIADRYLYIPLAGAALAVAGGLAPSGRWPRRPLAIRALPGPALVCVSLIACLLAFLVSTVRRLPAWHDSVTLWEEGRRGAPATPFVLNALGWAYWQVDRLDEAERALVQAAALAPGYTDPKLNLATIAFLRGDHGAAADYTEQVLRLAPQDSDALRYRGVLLEARGYPDLAVQALEAAVAANPFDRTSRRYLAELVAAQGERP